MFEPRTKSEPGVFSPKEPTFPSPLDIGTSNSLPEKNSTPIGKDGGSRAGISSASDIGSTSISLLAEDNRLILGTSSESEIASYIS